ncbi:MAG: peptidase U32 [Verrucomicrobiales bacterium]|nr:peptidase U32 [Verrucomicrobiales bacterium]
MSDHRTNKPELLAPAGDWECVKAAVENGADAIYFGLDKFNARMRAKNFTTSDLPELMAFLHSRGVRGYVTFNTLVFSNELADAERFLRSIIAAGVDAVIVQDIGVCGLIRKLSPDFPIHASTQMTVSSAGGLEFARKIGCDLVVLARECSIAEIESIQKANQSNLPVEVFVHGALCVAYSGQCLTSESLGGRSANRGECAQACRMPYELISDGKLVDTGGRQYLLSPQDLAGLEVVPRLVEQGIASLKIEGRLKSPEYVASITRVYRDAIDEVAKRDEQSDRYELEMAFSRGLFTGWFDGIDNQNLVHARFGKKRGVFLGEVTRVEKNHVWAKLESNLKAGDGIVFDANNPAEGEEGGRVFATKESRSGETKIEFRRGAVDFARVATGDKLWKTDDPDLNKRVRKTFDGDQPRYRRPVDFEVHGKAGEPLILIVRDELGRTVQADSEVTLQDAEKHALDEYRIAQQLGRLGGTPFEMGRIENELVGELMLPVSALNQVRRSAISKLEALRREPLRWKLNAEPMVFQNPPSESKEADAELIVHIREPHQLEVVLNSGTRTIYADFEDPKKYRAAVAQLREWNAANDQAVELFVAPPRVFKAGDEWILKQVRSCDADGYLIRNYDHLHWFSDDRMVGDFSLNVANQLTAEYFIQEFGLERVLASYDLNNVQLEALLKSAPANWFEVTIHQHMPMFYMEHCVFCAFMSKGRDYHDCGRPCDKHEVKLRDRVGMEHPLKADAGCRNTVYNARAQTGAESVQRLLELGVRRFRVDFLTEQPSEIATTIACYRDLLDGRMSGVELWQQLKLQNQLGVTRGQQFVME